MKIHNSRFIDIKCKKCGHIQKIFNKPAREIFCQKCNEILVKPKASYPEFTKNAEVLKEESKNSSNKE